MMKFTVPEPVDRKVPRRGPAYRELLRIRRRIHWRLTKMDEWQGAWNWEFFCDQVRRWQADEDRAAEIVGTWWIDLIDTLRGERNERARFVTLCQERVAREVKFLTGFDPRDPSGTLPQ